MIEHEPKLQKRRTTFYNFARRTIQKTLTFLKPLIQSEENKHRSINYNVEISSVFICSGGGKRVMG